MIKVLIVEDDPMVAALNRQFVEQIDSFMVCGAVSDTDKAKEFLSETDIDLILLDIHMPGMNGIEFLGWIREQQQDLDVILITAASEMEQIQRALRLGAADYLIKPFEFSRFQEALLQYKNNYHKIHDKSRVNQQELDRLLQRKNTPGTEPTNLRALPKGLTKNTLQTINEVILSMEPATFSTDELAKAVNISRVSVRKYLKFLTEIGYLDENLIYGVGRPIYQYQLNKEGSQRLYSYL
ncbi:response regulator [Planococcus halotolerans]|uniref:Transcriptional regulatory protein n=1 Tax=Planococcus halotolerans TaxID=2233542 RepID=A0A365KXG9_9BACL|nr:response regulator [Planococcus halotolerans]QHJ72174.1 response regulator [Planococcus halotolerans]RAZ77809.1 two-component system response regulator DcuR [Planococcus halotolerans]